MPGESPTILTGAQALVESLERVGVEVVFGIPGGAILPAYDPLYDSKIRHILVRHEQGAGHAAEGYAMVTGDEPFTVLRLLFIVGIVGCVIGLKLVTPDAPARVE